MKVAISMRSVHRPLMQGEMRVVDFVKYAASLAVDGVELDDVYLQGADVNYVEVQDVLRETGLKVSCYDIHHQLEPLQGRAQKVALEEIKAELAVAELLGAHFVKIAGGTFGPNIASQEVEELVLQLVDMVMPVLLGKDLILAIENPASSKFKSYDLARLVKQIDHPQVKVGFNMANALMAGEDPEQALQDLQDQIAHVRVADVRLRMQDEEPQSDMYVGCVVGLGLVPLEKLFRALRARSFEGWISLEFNGLENAYFGTEASLKNLRKSFAELQSDAAHADLV